MNTKKTALSRLVCIMAILAVLLLSGCKPQKHEFQDSLGNDIVLDKIPETLVSLSPALTETVFALGAGDRLVGVTEYCNRPEEAQQIEKVGDAFNVNMEKLVSLKPDLVLAAGNRDFESQSEKDVKRLEIPVYASGPSSVEEVFLDIEALSKVLGLEAQGKELADKLREEVEQIASQAELRAQSSPTVFVAIDETLWTVGPGSFVDEVVKLAGGKNVVDDVTEQYVQISMEDLLQKDPDVILVAIPEEYAAPLLEIPGWDHLTAVKEQRIFFVDPDLVSRPSPAVVLGIKEVYSFLYP